MCLVIAVVVTVGVTAAVLSTSPASVHAYFQTQLQEAADVKATANASVAHTATPKQTAPLAISPVVSPRFFCMARAENPQPQPLTQYIVEDSAITSNSVR